MSKISNMKTKLSPKYIFILLAVVLLALPLAYLANSKTENKVENSQPGDSPLLMLVYPEDMEETATVSQLEQGARLALKGLKSAANGSRPFQAKFKSVPLKNTPPLNEQFKDIIKLNPLALISVGPASFQAQIINLAEEKRIPLLYLNDSFCLTASSGNSSRVGEFSWGLGLATETVIEPLLNNLATQEQFERRYPRIFFLGTDSEDHVREMEAARITAEQLSYEEVDFLLLDPRVRDYVPALKTALDAKADIIFLSLNEQGSKLLLAQANAMNLAQDVILSGLSTFSFATEPKLENVLYIGSYSEKLNSKENADFIAGLNAEKLLYTSAIARGYDSIRLIAEAYNQSQGEVNKGLPLLKFNSLSGPVSFNRQNHLLSQNIFLMNDTDIVDSLGVSFKRDLKGCALP